MANFSDRNVGASSVHDLPTAEHACADADLLRRFAHARSQAAFAAFVGRHIDLVYSAALRRSSGDTHRAEDVVQLVFTAAAREADRLSRHPAIAAWLHTATRNQAINLAVAEQRRVARERSAAMTVSPADRPAPDWDAVRPVLDAAIDELNEPDRVAVLLRYFEQKSYADIGAMLNVSENSARMRTDRALEKLRVLLGRRGVRSTALALGATLAGRAVIAAPASLAAVVVGVVLRDVVGANALTLPKAAARWSWRPWFYGGAGFIAIALGTFLALPRQSWLTETPTTTTSAPSPVPTRESGSSTPAPADLTRSAPERQPTSAQPAARRAQRAAGAAPHASATAAEILQRMAESYKALTSYEDTGESRVLMPRTPLSDLEKTAPNFSEFQAATFQIAFAPPTLFRIELQTYRIEYRRGAVARVPEQKQLLLSDGRRGRINNSSDWTAETLGYLLEFGGTTYNAVPYHIPSLCVGGRTRKVSWLLSELTESRRLPDEVFADEPCFVVEGRTPTASVYVLWIDQKDLLIRKLRTSYPIDLNLAPTNSIRSAKSNGWIVEETHKITATNRALPPETFQLPP